MLFTIRPDFLNYHKITANNQSISNKTR